MAVVAGSFETQTQAEDAVARLKVAGFGEGDFSLISHADEAVGAPDDNQQRADRQIDVGIVGAAVGAVLGGALLGPVGAVVGGLAAGGGLAAALRPLGMTEEEAAEYERRLHAGRYVLAVQASDRTAEVRNVLAAAGADDLEVRGT
ncbi:MAG: general stress protein [Chloroflexota bacterium]